MIWFTSDLHFGADDILEREQRPFKTITEFQEYCLKLWNNELHVTDTLYIIGDYCTYNYEAQLSYDEVIDTYKTVRRINCHVILVVGNNEQRIIDKFFNGDFKAYRECLIELGFYSVVPEAYIQVAGEYFYLNHLPSNHKDNYVNLFGHVHRISGIWKPFGLNVGCDLNHFRLHDINSILMLLDYKEKFWDEDIECNS